MDGTSTITYSSLYGRAPARRAKTQRYYSLHLPRGALLTVNEAVNKEVFATYPD